MRSLALYALLGALTALTLGRAVERLPDVQARLQTAQGGPR